MIGEHAPPPVPGETCGSCRHWAERIDAVLPVGQCRLDGPVAADTVDGVVYAGWPVTRPAEWCSRFVVRRRS